MGNFAKNLAGTLILTFINNFFFEVSSLAPFVGILAKTTRKIGMRNTKVRLHE